jgi:hypothetical protein
MGIKYAFIIAFIIAICSCDCFSQNLFITGKVVSEQTHLPIKNVTINIYNKNKIIDQSLTDSLGSFKITIDQFNMATHIIFHSLNYDDNQMDHLPKMDNVNYDIGIIKMNAHSILLKEVKIKEEKRFHDTTIIDLSKQKFERSIMTDDLFSQYGFSKDSKGSLYYKGKLVADIMVNGVYFFGKNNMDVYKYLPALTMKNIEIVETNVDSLTNTRLENPLVKVNFKLKKEYNKGKFGAVNAGVGTSHRYIFSGDLYSYRNDEQVSVSENLNNINLQNNNILDQGGGFFTNGNDSKNNISQISYRNLYNKKIELNAFAKVSLTSKSYLSQLQTQSESLKQFSETDRSSFYKTFNLENSNISLDYKINNLDNINFNQGFSYNNNKQTDSSSYLVIQDTTKNHSQLNKLTHTNIYNLNSNIEYRHKFSAHSNSYLRINISFYKSGSNNTENNTVFDSKQIKNTYFINGARSTNSKNFVANITYNEQFFKEGYLQYFAKYDRTSLEYNVNINTDTTLLYNDEPIRFINNIYQVGIKSHAIIQSLFIDGLISGMLYSRDIKNTQSNTETFFYPNIDLKASLKINKKKNISIAFTTAPLMPNVNQITNINNSFDLVIQTQSNPNLNPEVSSKVNLSFDFKKSDSSAMVLSASLENIGSKIGYNIKNTTNTLQTMYLDNIGNSRSAGLSLQWNKTIKNGKTFNSNTNFAFSEAPAMDNQIKYLNHNIAIGQSVSTNISLIRTFLTMTPNLMASYSHYNYSTSNVDAITASYSDNISLILGKIRLGLYPFATCNKSITTNLTWAINSDLKMSVFKNYGTIWIKAYDLFNSYKYYNNYFGANYIQTVRYSNLNRYIIGGLSLKLNNIK